MTEPNAYYEFIPKLLNMSLTASVMILVVLLMRLCLKKAPKIFSYVLWSVVLFRLLCPVSVSSEWSLLSWFDVPVTEEGSMEYVPENIVHMENPAVDLPIPAVSEVVNEQLPQGEEQIVGDPLEAPIAIATYVWVVGVGTLVIYSVLQFAMLRRRLVGAVCLRGNIYLADHIDTPFAVGLFRPRIYLPSALAEEERDYIIMHERHHIRRGDHVVKLLAFGALCIHWFNPLVWLAFVLSGKDMEMSCDEAVMKKAGKDIRADYSQSLLRCATGRRILMATPLAFGEGDTKDRVKNVMNYKKPAFWVIPIAIVLCAVMAVCLATNPAPEQEIDGFRYRVKEIIYDAPQYSFTYTLEAAPRFIVGDDWILMERHLGAAWQSRGRLQKVDYSRTERYGMFEQDPLYVSNQVSELMDRVTAMYRVDVSGDGSNTFYMVMQTKKNELLMAVGYGKGTEGKVRWLFELEQENDALNMEELEAEIEDMSGQPGTIFAVYESDTLPGLLLVGYEEDDNDLGYAKLQYLESSNRYDCRGCGSFGGGSLFSTTIAKEEGLDHSVTIALSRREDLAEVTAQVGDHLLRKGVSSCPAMVVFEWPELLEEDAGHVDVRFYNTASEELER